MGPILPFGAMVGGAVVGLFTLAVLRASAQALFVLTTDVYGRLFYWHVLYCTLAMLLVTRSVAAVPTSRRALLARVCRVIGKYMWWLLATFVLFSLVFSRTELLTKLRSECFVEVVDQWAGVKYVYDDVDDDRSKTLRWMHPILRNMQSGELFRAEPATDLEDGLAWELMTTKGLKITDHYAFQARVLLRENVFGKVTIEGVSYFDFDLLPVDVQRQVYARIMNDSDKVFRVRRLLDNHRELASSP